MKVSFILNGKLVTLDVKPNEILLDVLRFKLGIRSVKRGCERGECGTCTVLMDGKPVYSCMILAPQVEGHEITTIEGLNGPIVKSLIKSFISVGAVQCGYCTPGFILTAYALLKRNLNPTPDEVKKAIEGNLCRCTGYKKIIDAILKAAKELRREFEAYT